MQMLSSPIKLWKNWKSRETRCQPATLVGRVVSHCFPPQISSDVMAVIGASLARNKRITVSSESVLVLSSVSDTGRPLLKCSRNPVTGYAAAPISSRMEMDRPAYRQSVHVSARCATSTIIKPLHDAAPWEAQHLWSTGFYRPGAQNAIDGEEFVV